MVGKKKKRLYDDLNKFRIFWHHDSKKGCGENLCPSMNFENWLVIVEVQISHDYRKCSLSLQKSVKMRATFTGKCRDNAV